MAVPQGKLKKISSSAPIIIKSDPIPGRDGVDGIDGLAGPEGPQGPIGPKGDKGDAPDVNSIIEALLASPELTALVAKEIGKIPAEAFGGRGGSGKMDVTDLPGYKSAQAGQVFGVLSSGKVGFFDIAQVEAEVNYIRLVDTDGDYKYVGEALPSTATSAPTWRIKRIEFLTGVNDGDVEILWANGTGEFSHIWDDRTLYTYS